MQNSYNEHLLNGWCWSHLVLCLSIGCKIWFSKVLKSSSSPAEGEETQSLWSMVSVLSQPSLSLLAGPFSLWIARSMHGQFFTYSNKTLCDSQAQTEVQASAMVRYNFCTPKVAFQVLWVNLTWRRLIQKLIKGCKIFMFHFFFIVPFNECGNWWNQHEM